MVLATVITTMLLLVPLPASAQPPPPFDAFDFTRNMHPQGFSPNPDTINSDLAFWGNLAFQGTSTASASSTSAPPAVPARSPSRSAWQSGRRGGLGRRAGAVLELACS
jgi:hypothetical protein